MALDIASNRTLKTVQANVNAPNFANNYSDAFNGRAFLIPKGVGQIGAFAFDYRGDDEVDLETEVTDHWLEDNNAVQDHIGVKPFVVTVKGFVAELALSRTTLAQINRALASVTSGLSQVPAFLGAYTPGAVDSLQKAITQAQNVAIQIEQAAARAAQVASFFPSGPAMNRQQAAYFQLSSLAMARIIFTVATPFQIFDNMAITSLRVIQPKDTKGWSDFTVKMKQLNFTQELSLPFFSANKAGRTSSQSQPGTEDGSTQGTSVPSSAVLNSFGAVA